MPSAIRGPVDQAHHRQRRHGLAAARLADDGERAALADLEVDPVDCAQEASAVEPGAQVLGGGSGTLRAPDLGGHLRRRRRGGNVDVPLELLEHVGGITRLQGLEQHAMLLDRLL